MLNEFRFQLAREDRPRPYDGPDITGQTRPFPDTAFDFGSSYRFGMPFFLPVEYNDTRFQITNNLSWLIKGRHTIKVGARVQPRELGADLHRLRQRPLHLRQHAGLPQLRAVRPEVRRVLERLDQHDGRVPGGRQHHRAAAAVPAAGRRRRAVGRGGRHAGRSRRSSRRSSSRTSGSRRRTSRSSTASAGRRRSSPIRSRRPTEVFYARFIGQPGFPSDGTIPSDMKMWQPRLGISWDPGGDGKQVVRLSAGLFYARIPGLSLASSRSTNGSRGQTLYRDSTFNGFGVTPPDLAEPDSAVADREPGPPGRVRVRQGLPEPAHGLGRRWRTSASSWRTCRCSSASRTRRRCTSRGSSTATTPVFGSPWRTGLGAERHQRHRRADGGRELGQGASTTASRSA